MTTEFRQLDTEYDLLWKIVVRRGGHPEVHDNFWCLLVKWLDAEVGGVPTFEKIVVAAGDGPYTIELYTTTGFYAVEEATHVRTIYADGPSLFLPGGSLRFWSCTSATDDTPAGNITFLNVQNTTLSALDVSDLSALTNLYCNTNQLVTLDVSGLASLAHLEASNNQLSTLDLSDLVALNFLGGSNNAFTESAVDGILSLLVTFGLTGGTVTLSGGTSSPPSVAGLADKTTLESRGWTVVVN